MSSIVVHKYGGSSVANLERLQAVAQHIAAEVAKGKKPVIVVSAMGSQTNDLLKLAHDLNELPPKRELDMLLSAGERIATSLLAIALNKLKVPSISFTGSQVGIITDDNHGNARIQAITGNRIRQSLDEQKVVIVAGFQGVSAISKDVTTLGRGGSDLTAIALAIFLNADVCELYKDVTGIFSTDPKSNKNAKKIGRLTWNEMTTLAEYGAKVLHHRAAFLAQKFKLPYMIRSSFDLNEHGTLVIGDHEMEAAYVRAMTPKKDLCLYEINIPLSSESLNFFERISDLCKEWDIVPILNRVSQNKSNSGKEVGSVKVELAIPELYEKNLLEALEKFNQGMKSNDLIKAHLVKKGIFCLTLIGGNLHIEQEVMGYVLRKYKDALAFMDAKSSCLHIGLNVLDSTEAMNDIHDRFVKN